MVHFKIPYIILSKLGPILSLYIFWSNIWAPKSPYITFKSNTWASKGPYILSKVIYGLKNGPRSEVIYGSLKCITGYNVLIWDFKLSTYFQGTNFFDRQCNGLGNLICCKLTIFFLNYHSSWYYDCHRTFHLYLHELEQNHGSCLNCGQFHVQ